jgi:hypothetical protein
MNHPVGAGFTNHNRLKQAISKTRPYQTGNPHLPLSKDKKKRYI